MNRFCAETAEELGESTFPPASDRCNYPPRVHFSVESDGRRLVANPHGAGIECVLCGEDDDRSRVTISTNDHQPIARVTVHAGEHVGADDITTETIAIASAIYWSWWRARDMNGDFEESPGRVTDNACTMCGDLLLFPHSAADCIASLRMQLGTMTSDRDEWRTQHENALACWRSDIDAIMAARHQWSMRDGLPVCDKCGVVRPDIDTPCRGRLPPI